MFLPKSKHRVLLVSRNYYEKKTSEYLFFSQKYITFAKSFQQAAASAFPGKKVRKEEKEGFYRPPLDLTPLAVQFNGDHRLI